MATRPTQSNLLPFLYIGGTLLAAAGTSYFVLKVISHSETLAEEAAKPKETVSVVVAVHDLYMGVPITDADVTVAQFLPELVPPENVFKSIDEVRGRTPRERVLSNELIREERLARADAGVGLNAIISPGKRAITVATNTETAVAGLLQPGNYVDIIVTIRPENPEDVGARWVSKTILQGIRVLAVGSTISSVQPDPKDKTKGNTQRNLKPSITLEVTPDEAEQLALATSQGDVHVTLRTDTDFTQIDSNSVTTAARIIGLQPETSANTEDAPPPQIARPQATPAPTPTAPSAEVISGSDATQVTFGSEGTTETKRRKNR